MKNCPHIFPQHAPMSDALTKKNRARLADASVATVTTVLFRRGFRNTVVQGILPLNPVAPRMVGPAFTLRYVPAREDLDVLEIFHNPLHPQRRAIEECPPGAVMVIDSRKDPRAASAGGILAARLMKRGAAGMVTDGGFRDAPDIARLPFPAYHRRPSPPTNLVLHHAVDAEVPIGCGDAPVYPGDIVVGDGEGVVVIPAKLANEVAEEAANMTAYENFVIEKVMAGRKLPGLYPASEESLAEFARWRRPRKRRN